MSTRLSPTMKVCAHVRPGSHCAFDVQAVPMRRTDMSAAGGIGGGGGVGSDVGGAVAASG